MRTVRGFTLLELLVVLVIIAVLVTMVVPVMGRNDGRDIVASAERAAMLINLARQESVLSARIWRVVFEPETGKYYFEHYSGADFNAVDTSPFAGKHELPVSATVEVAGEPADAEAAVTLFPTGEQDPFRMTMKAGEIERAIVMGPVGEARVERHED